MNSYGSSRNWHTYGGGRPKSPLYGIWDVEQVSVDAQLHPPLFTDRDRWRRAIFDFPTRITFQRPDDSFAGYGVSINLNKKTLALTKDSDKKWKANFTFERATKDQLILDGENGQPQDSHAAAASARRQVPTRKPRLPLDQRIPLQSLKD
jgi:hypothetical protein